MLTTPLMPKATAVWLVDNTSLSFDQIAVFCNLHTLEVQAIADGESAVAIKGVDPIAAGQLTRDEIERAEANPSYRLKITQPATRVPEKKRKGPRYTPVSQRQDRPNAILWLMRHHPELKDAQIMRLVGTTKPTIATIRDRTHWNIANLQPVDPVAVGLTSQIDLDFEVEKAAKLLPEEERPKATRPTTLLPASETVTAAAAAAAAALGTASLSLLTGEEAGETANEREAERAADREADAVFAKLKSLKSSGETDSDS